MRFTLNGTPTVAEGTVANLVEQRFGAGAGKGMAVAVNGIVVPRGAWVDTAILDGDRIDVVTAVQGG
jgi:sulfur carrier protein